MTIQSNSEAMVNASAQSMLSLTYESVARWVSRLGSPPLLAITGIIMGAQAANTTVAWNWAGFYILVAVLLPVSYVVWLVQQGQVTDFDLRCREQRHYPYIVASLSNLAAWLVLYWGQAPAEFVLLAGAAWVQVILLLAITLRWKISAHAASAASFTVWTWFIFGVVAAPVILIIPLIAWSRLRLQRHDLPQTMAGTLLGSSVLAATLYLGG